MRLNIGIWLVLLGIKIMPRTEGKRVADFLRGIPKETVNAKDIVKPVSKGETV